MCCSLVGPSHDRPVAAVSWEVALPIGRQAAGFHPFRRIRVSILQTCEARTLFNDYSVGGENVEISGRYGKQLLENVVWRPDCAAMAGLGFTLSVPEEESQIVGQAVGQVGQVLRVAEQQAIAPQVHKRAGNKLVGRNGFSTPTSWPDTRRSTTIRESVNDWF